MKRRHHDLLGTAIGIVLIAVLIQCGGALKRERLVFPDVISILRAFVRLLQTPATYAMILTSFAHLLAALAIAVVIGSAVGIAEGFSEMTERILRPLMVLIRAVPMIVLIIIVMVLVDYRRVPVVAPTIMLIPLISEAACEGFRQIPQELIDVYRMNSGLNATVLWRVYLPLMSGYLRQAYIEAVGTGMKLVITAEYMVQTRNSLGKAVFSSSYFNEYQDIYAYALVMVLLILVLGEAPMLALRRMAARRSRENEKNTGETLSAGASG